MLAWRFIPFLILCYFVAYLDRVNVGFAKLTMDPDLSLTETAFGFGAWRLLPFVFSVRGALERYSGQSRRADLDCAHHDFLGRRLGRDGLHSSDRSSNGFERGSYTFYALRFLLGLAEAGFFPGIIFFLTLWFPAAYRARIVGYFMAAIPLSYAVSSPVSAALLGLEGAAGFGAAGAMAVHRRSNTVDFLLAFAAYLYLTDRPADARWLPDDRRRWLQGRLAAEDVRRERVSPVKSFLARPLWTTAFLRCRSSISAAWHAATA